MARAGTFAFSCLLLVSSFAGCLDPAAPNEIQQAIDYLVHAQNPDGGFPPSPGAPSDFSTSAWVALAFAATGTAPPATADLGTYLSDQSETVRGGTTGSLSRVNPISLYVLAGLALGVSGARWNETDPVAQLQLEAENETLALNEDLFLVGALARAEASGTGKIYRRVGEELSKRRDEGANPDGWHMAIALLVFQLTSPALRGPFYDDYLRYLQGFQRESGGVAPTSDDDADASTTSMALAAWAETDSGESRTKAWAYLARLQLEDGSVRFSEDIEFAPVKTTAEAILGWTGRGPFRA